MSHRHATALGRTSAYFLEEDTWPDAPPPDTEIIRPKTAPHSAVETYTLSACIAVLGFIVCHDLVSNILIAAIATPILLQIAGLALIPFCRGHHGIILILLLTTYAILFLPANPVTIIWLSLCALNLTCWLFQQITKDTKVRQKN